MGTFIDLTGNRYGRLTVIGRDGNGLPVRWMCKCDCGNTKSILGYHLRKGKIRSCGCYRVEEARANNTTHNLSGTRIFKIWAGMHKRCENPKGRVYKHYGERGIKVCDEWKDFLPFYEWSMANGYQENLTIDRINVNGNYEPENCRWISAHEQSRNTTRTKYITYKGETKPLVVWCEELGKKYNLVKHRLYSGWTPEQAFETPAGGHHA